jgi:hypothetical protein
MFRKLIIWWLTGILLFLPFQNIIKKVTLRVNIGLSTLIGYLDEITILIFLLLAFLEIYKNRERFNYIYFAIFLPIIVFCLAGIVSGLVNGNMLYVTVLGISNYIKYFFLVFIYSVFFRKYDEFKKVFYLLLSLAVFISIIGVLQEAWAMISRYLLMIDVEKIDYLFAGNLKPKESWRFGIYRAPSLVYNANLKGLYCLLILIIYVNITKKMSYSALLTLFFGIFTSASRRVFTGFIIFLGFYARKLGKAFLIAISIPVIISVYYLSTQIDFSKLKTPGSLIVSEGADIDNFRKYNMLKAFEIWNDFPVMGVGPGMFGGITSIKTHSPLYEEYNYRRRHEATVKTWGGIDQYWPQLLAETGIIGLFAYCGLLASLLILFGILRKRTDNVGLKGLFTGLAMFMLIVIIYSFGSSINFTPILFTYLACVGMGVGSVSFNGKSSK